MLEDEGRMIGSNHLPECLRDRMVDAPVVVVEDPFEVRPERLREEYFDHMWADFSAAYGEKAGWKAYSEYLHHGLYAIRRRLGCNASRNLPPCWMPRLSSNSVLAALTRTSAGLCRC